MSDQPTSSGFRPLKTFVREVLEWLNRIAPREWALPGDPVGLQVGSVEMEVERVGVALDAEPRSVAAAAYRQCQLLVTHHPLIYRPLAQVRFEEPVGEALRLLCESRIALLVVHTNWDCAPGGTNDALAARLGLEEVRPFGEGARVPTYKLVTFVPPEHLDPVLDAMAKEGAGEIGLYQRCAFYQEGTGTYEPQPGAQPFLGTVGKREQVQEYRLEVLVEAHRLNCVLEAMLRTHPYEEVAYDLYPLHPPRTYPMGRVGRLPKPMSAQQLRDYLAQRLGNPQVRMYGKAQKVIRTLAVVGGAGGDYLHSAKASLAEAMLTGEVRHHHTWEAASRDLVLFEGGHAETEAPGVEALAERLQEFLQPRGVEVVWL